MMTEVFFGSMAFSMALLAFIAGTWFTVNSINNPNGGKLMGYVITALAILSLVFTSYNVARVVFMQKTMQKMMYSRMNGMHPMMKQGMQQHNKMKQQGKEAQKKQ